MGELVSFAEDIDHVGEAFTRAARDLGDALTQLQRASAHVRHAFHNHPDHADAAVAPFKQLHGPVDQIQQLVEALGGSLRDVADSYRNNDSYLAKGWKRIPTTFNEPGRR